MKRIIATIGATGFFFSASMSSAFAHNSIVSSSPKAGAILTTWPAKISLVFNENLVTVAGKSVNWVTIEDSSTRHFESGGSNVKGNSVSVATKSVSHNGKFTVRYRVVSADGHPVTGSFIFSLRDKESK